MARYAPQNEIRKRAIAGDFFSVPITDWEVPKWKMCIFISSTFTDTQLERNILLEQIYPRLRKLASLNNVEVTFVDMRFGVRDESTLDHKTWIQCSKELQRCQRESTGLYFLSLQADKYGYCPLPRTLEQSVFDERLGQLEKDSSARILAQEWYTLDSNAKPPVYVLKSLDSLNDSEYWNNALPVLRKLLENLPFDSQFCDDLVIGRSITEWEVKRSLLDESNLSRCFWIHRHFQNESNGMSQRKKSRIGAIKQQEGSDHIEKMFSTGDLSEKLKLGNLKGWMTSKLASQQLVVEYADMTLEEYNAEEDQTRNDYLNKWEHTTESLLQREVEKIVQLRSRWDEDGGGIGEKGEVLAEVLHHAAWAYEKCESFEGREDLLAMAMEKFAAANRISDAETDTLTHKFSGISFAVTGSSGCGKTAMVAKIAQRVVERELRDSNDCLIRPVLVRFCGTSEHSSNGLSLVRSLCSQIMYLFDYEDKSTPSTYQEVCECFFELVNKHAVIVLIDSIDQLSDSHFERSRISFLEYVDPHPDTRIIVSCLADERDSQTKKWLYCFGCDTRLNESDVPKLVVPGFTQTGDDVSDTPGSDGNAKYVIEKMLEKRSRGLTPSQWSFLMEKVAVEPTALYTRLAVRTVMNWSSFDENVELKETVRGLILQILDGVEREYGVILTRCALGFITFSVGGIKNDEMEDLLSLDDEVLDSVFQYHTPNVRRLPSHVWLRLLDELSDLVVERDHGCVRWYHRQLQEVAEERYEDLKERLHKLMGQYFGDMVDINVRSDRQISTQPLTKTETMVWLPGARINHRRCVEALYHMIEAKMIPQAVKQLCDFNIICALVKSDEGFNIVRHLVKVSDMIKDNEAFAKEQVYVDHYLRWLCQSMTRIVTSPENEIFSTCTTTQPLESLARCDLYEYVMRGRHKKLRSFTKDSWYRGIALGGKKKFDKLLSVLEGHTDNVRCVAWHPFHEKIASASEDGLVYIWDATSGSVITTLQGHDEGVLAVAWRPDGEKIASGSLDNTVKIWDAFTGSIEATFSGHSSHVDAVAWSPDGKAVISGADFKDILVWSPLTGKVLVKFTDMHAEGVSSIYVGPSSSILSACRGGRILLWNVSNKRIIQKFEGHTSGVSHACWSPCFSQIASSSLDGSVRTWDVKTGACILKMEGFHRFVTYAKWSPDGSRIAASYGDKAIRIWDAKVGVLMLTLEGHVQYVMCLSWCPDSRRLVSGAEDETVRIWDAECDSTGSAGCDGHSEENLFDGHTASVNSVAWDSRSKYVASASSDRSVILWDIEEGTVHGKFEGHTDKVVSVVWGPHDSMIATASHDSTVRVWNVQSKGTALLYENHVKYVTCVSWNTERGLIASGSYDKTLRVWSADTGEDIYVASMATDRVLCTAWNYSGSLCAFGSKDKLIRVVALDEHTVCSVLEGHNGAINSIAWSRDGLCVVSGSADKTICIWNVDTSAMVSKFEGHGGSVLCVAWSPNNKMVASSSEDTSIRVWNIVSGSVVCTYEGHTSPVVGVAWNSESEVLASASMDETVRTWDSVELSAKA